ncbi:MAG TPA: tetratricopeptide repeat protein [Micavibrio sp.]|nr:tetratricopeptide repeat protein [Micavibrio sp.]
MTKNRSSLLLAFSALALLTACDDGGNSGKMSWLDWLKGKDEPQKMTLIGLPSDYIRETQAGNYLAGQFAQYRGDWKTANKYLDKVIRIDPTNVELQQRAMVLAMQAGDTNRALVLARKVLEEDERNLLALLFIGVDQIARQEYAASIRTFTKMPENGIADFVRPILIAWAKAPDKKVDDEMLVASGPLHAYHALLIADYLGKVQDADKYFVTVLAGGGADAHILEMMGDVYARQGNKEIADKIYDTLITQAVENGMAERAETLKAKRDNPELAKTGRIQTPSQGAAEAFYNMARILYNDQSDESALVFARLSQHLTPAKVDTKMLMARMMVRGDHLQEAIDFYKSVPPESTDYHEAQRSAAELFEKEGKIDESIAFLEQSYAQDKDLNALIQIGDVYRRAERHLEAIKAYDRAVAALGGKVSSDYWHLLYARGMSYERSGNLKKAEDDLEAAMEFRPDHPYLLNYLGYSWADQGKKLDKSLELITKAANLKPDDGYIIDSLGWVYYKLGNFDDAVAQLEKAIELVPYDPTINDHLGDAYWRVGRKNEARFQWLRAKNNSTVDKDKAALELKISDGLDVKKSPVMEAKTAPHPEDPVKR